MERGIISKGKRWSDDEVKQLLELQAEGRTVSEISEEIGRNYKSVDTKLRALELEPNKEADKPKEPKKKRTGATPQKQAVGGILKKASAEIADDAVSEFDEVVEIGKFAHDNWNTIARSKGMSLVDYLQQVMVFYTNYHDLIEKLEWKIKEQEKTIEELTDFLDPVRYRVAIIERLIAQEGQGIPITPEKIKTYLDFVDYSLGKDLPPQPEIEGAEVEPLGQ